MKKDFRDFEIKEPLDQFEKEIAAYESDPVETGKIIFYGSSCFTRWSKKYGHKPLEECIPGTLNHGFGGSNIHQLCYYYERMVKAYKPRAVVITTYINDRNHHYTIEEMMGLTECLFGMIRSDFPDIPIYVTDYRPASVERSDGFIKENFMLNDALKKLCEKYENVKVIELSKETFYYTAPEYAGSYRNINDSIFVSDHFHFTQEGYDLLCEALKRHLKDIL